MNFKCLFNGHDYKVVTENRLEPDYKEEFYATNLGTRVTYHEYTLYQCNRCLKQKRVYTGTKYICDK